MRLVEIVGALKRKCQTASTMRYAVWQRFVWWVTMYNKVFIP